MAINYSQEHQESLFLFKILIFMKKKLPKIKVQNQMNAWFLIFHTKLKKWILEARLVMHLDRFSYLLNFSHIFRSYSLNRSLYMPALTTASHLYMRRQIAITLRRFPFCSHRMRTKFLQLFIPQRLKNMACNIKFFNDN